MVGGSERLRVGLTEVRKVESDQTGRSVESVPCQVRSPPLLFSILLGPLPASSAKLTRSAKNSCAALQHSQ